MAKKVKVIVLRTAGTNCDRETQFAFEEMGADVDLVHMSQLLGREKKLEDFHILVIPGGFTYGDDIAAGKIMANELRIKLGNDIRQFIQNGKLIIGICNGFQILTKAGILPGVGVQNFEPRPDNSIGFSQTATLMTNDSGKFEDRWIYLKPNGRCVWSEGIKEIISLPVAHGEGKFVPKDDTVLKKLKENGQIIFRYCNKMGDAPVYPENPNGSIEDIAAIADQAGRVFGLMPHPERHFLATQHPHWTRLKKKGKFGDGAKIFQNGVNYVKEKLF